MAAARNGKLFAGGAAFLGVCAFLSVTDRTFATREPNLRAAAKELQQRLMRSDTQAFGCVNVVTDSQGRPAGLRVLVATRRAERRARRLAGRLGVKRQTVTKRMDRRHSLVARRRVGRAVERERPPTVTLRVKVAESQEAATGAIVRNCPRVALFVGGQAADFAYAREKQLQYGDDRIEIFRPAGPGTPAPPPERTMRGRPGVT